MRFFLVCIILKVMGADAPDQQLDVRAQLRHTDDNAATHCSSYLYFVSSVFVFR